MTLKNYQPKFRNQFQNVLNNAFAKDLTEEETKSL
jgi:hypothetical protein